MKNVQEHELLKCFCKYSSDFASDVCKAFDEDLEIGFDGGDVIISDYDSEEEIDYETVLEKLSAYYDVDVTNLVRVGDCYESYVHVFYKDNH